MCEFLIVLFVNNSVICKLCKFDGAKKVNHSTASTTSHVIQGQ